MSLNLNVSSVSLPSICLNVRGEDVGNTEDKLTLLDLRSKGDGGSVFGSDLLWGLLY